MPAFIPGLELSRMFFAEEVRPVLGDAFPALRYAAALLGHGSEVLGFDTEMSTDHDWGPRVDLFLSDDAEPDVREQIDAALRDRLPRTFRGYFALRGFAAEICKQIADESVRRLAELPLIGSIDQFSDSTDLAEDVGRRLGLRALYE